MDDGYVHEGQPPPRVVEGCSFIIHRAWQVRSWPLGLVVIGLLKPWVFNSGNIWQLTHFIATNMFLWRVLFRAQAESCNDHTALSFGSVTYFVTSTYRSARTHLKQEIRTRNKGYLLFFPLLSHCTTFFLATERNWTDALSIRGWWLQGPLSGF